MTVHAVQINFFDYHANIKKLGVESEMKRDYHAYKLLASEDGENWKTLADRSENRKPIPHDYIELEAPAKYRHFKVENVHSPLAAISRFPISASSVTATAKRRKPSRISGRNATRTMTVTSPSTGRRSKTPMVT